jgi:hypothetical protein
MQGEDKRMSAIKAARRAQREGDPKLAALRERQKLHDMLLIGAAVLIGLVVIFSVLRFFGTIQ